MRFAFIPFVLSWAALHVFHTVSIGILAIYWLCSLLFFIHLLKQVPFFAHGLWLSIGGMSLNAIACLSNGGRMPVLDYNIDAGAFWQPMPANVNFYYLCDIWHWWSLGDGLMIAAVPVVLCELYLKRHSLKAVAS